MGVNQVPVASLLPAAPVTVAAPGRDRILNSLNFVTLVTLFYSKGMCSPGPRVALRAGVGACVFPVA
jgi:hypothetical protein